MKYAFIVYRVGLGALVAGAGFKRSETKVDQTVAEINLFVFLLLF